MAGATEGSGTPHSGNLARTGVESWVLILIVIGVLLIVVGAAVWAVSRRRRAEVT